MPALCAPNSPNKILRLQRPPTYTRSSSVSSFRSTLSNLKRGQQYLGTLVAVVRSIRYTYTTTSKSPIIIKLHLKLDTVFLLKTYSAGLL